MATTILRKARPVQHIAAKSKVVERIDPDEDFSDVIGDDITRFALENERSDRHYVWPHNDNDDISKFQAHVLNYMLETYAGDDDEHALRPRGMKGLLKKGDTIAIADHVLMSCDRAKWEKRQRYEASLTRNNNKAKVRQLQEDLVLPTSAQ